MIFYEGTDCLISGWMKSEGRKISYIFVMAPRCPKEHRFASEFPGLASLSAVLFLRVSTSPSASFHQCSESPFYYSSYHKDKVDEKFEKLGDKTLLY